MTYFYESKNRVVDGTARSLGDNDSIYVSSGISIGSRLNAAGVSATSGASVQVFGSILSVGGTGFFANGGGNIIHIGAGGNISGDFEFGMGIDIEGTTGANHVINDGTVSGNTAIFLGGPGNLVDNTGTIAAYEGSAITFAGSGVINNSGTLEAANSPTITFGTFDDAVVTINNTGTIIGGRPEVGGSQAVAIQIGARSGIVTNTGHIVGDINLGTGNDTYYGGEGTVSGNIEAGDGDDIIVCGAGRNFIAGRAGADQLEGGAGRDTFIYTADHFDHALESKGSSHDTIMDFDFRKDIFSFDNFSEGPHGIDAAVTHGALNAASFNADLAAALPAAHLKVGHAVLFMPNSGDYAGEVILVIDANAKAGYQADKEWVIDLHGADNIDHFTMKVFDVQ